MISRQTPMISQVTPTAFTMAMILTAIELINVVATSTITPSRMAFVAPVIVEIAGSPPTSWKPDQIAGSTACMAIAAADTVTICARIIVQPANQPVM